jgi:hypothetical protein
VHSVTHPQAVQPDSQPELRMVLVDPRVQWSEAKNIWHNAAIRTVLYTLAAPFRWVRRRFFA